MKWEYKIVYINAKKRTSTGLPEEINEEFDRYGANGWELVRVEPKLDGGFMAFGFGWIHQPFDTSHSLKDTAAETNFAEKDEKSNYFTANNIDLLLDNILRLTKSDYLY